MAWLLTFVPVPAFLLIGLSGTALSCAVAAAWYRMRAANWERWAKSDDIPKLPLPHPIVPRTPYDTTHCNPHHDCTIDRDRYHA